MEQSLGAVGRLIDLSFDPIVLLDETGTRILMGNANGLRLVANPEGSVRSDLRDGVERALLGGEETDFWQGPAPPSGTQSSPATCHEVRFRRLRAAEDGIDGVLLAFRETVGSAGETDAGELSAAARLAALADASPVLIWEGDSQGQLTFCNASIRAFVGATVEELRQRSWASFIHPDDLEAESLAWALATREGREYRGRYRLRRHDGTYRWVLSTVRPVRDASGRVSGWFGSTVDIDDQVRGESALRESNNRLRLALETTSAIMFNQDLDLRYTWLYRPELGFYGERLVGSTEFDLLEREEDAHAVMAVKRRAIDGGEPVRETLNIRHRGADRWFDLNVHPTLDQDGRVVGVTCAAVDVTDRIVKENALRHALDGRERVLRELNHRIKNSLQLVASLLRLQASQIPTEAQQEFDRACQRVTAIADVHARLYLTEEVGLLDFGEYFANAVPRLAESFMPAREVEVEVVEAVGDLDVDRAIPLALVVNELITNAILHAFDGTTDGRIQTGFRNGDGELRFWVHDNGRGAADMPTGLGLRLVNALVEQIAGRMTVTADNGTRIEIRAPETPSVHR